MRSARPIRGVLGTAALGAAVVGALMLSACDGTTDRGSPSSPVAREGHTPGATGQTAAHAIIDAPGAYSFDSSVDGRGDLLTVWFSGFHYDRPTALAVRDADGDESVAVGPPRAQVLAALPDGWLVRGDHGLVRLDNDGDIVPVIGSSGRSISPRPGDVAYSQGSATSGYRTATNTTYPLGRLLHQVHGRGAVIAPDGSLLTLATHDGSVAAARLRDDGWSYTTLDAGDGVAAGEIVGSGRSVIAFTTSHPAPLGDDAEDPVHRVAVSTDAGEHWRSATVPGGESVVLSMAVSRSGTGFVSIGAPHGRCSLLRIDKAGAASCVDVPTIQVFAHDDRVYSTFFRRRRQPYRLLVSDDQGTTWRSAAVPGRS